MLSTWTRTAMAAAVVVLIFGIVAGLAVSGRLGDLRYANIPVVHPWPPAGYYQNPFNPADKGDLINAADAGRVKGDLVADGQVELKAFVAADTSVLTQGDAGNRLAKLMTAVAGNRAAGVSESFQNHLSKVLAGRLADPNDPSVTWCVEEIGVSDITISPLAGGAVIHQQTLRFDDKFWLVLVDGRYLITDAEVRSSG